MTTRLFTYVIKMKVGYAYARLLPAGVKYEKPSIGRVVVRENLRGEGLAHTLMECAVGYMLKEWKPESIQLQAQTHLASF